MPKRIEGNKHPHAPQHRADVKQEVLKTANSTTDAAKTCMHNLNRLIKNSPTGTHKITKPTTNKTFTKSVNDKISKIASGKISKIVK